MSGTEVQVATDSNVVHVRVGGRATFACCQCLRDFLLHAIAEGSAVFQFDMAHCDGMDSTFMGVLAMLALRTKPPKGYVQILNAGEKVHGSLESLGIARLFRFASADTSGEPWVALGESPEETESARRAMRATMVQAHETLGAVNPENICKFKDVLDFLKEEEQHEG